MREMPDGVQSDADTQSDAGTAHRHWDAIWETGAGQAEWSRADPWVVNTISFLRSRNVLNVLDLGCGVGRHASLLASEGFTCYALDRSESGVSRARESEVERASVAGVAVSFMVGDMQELPFDTASFDYVLAFNVVYHGDDVSVGATIAEIRRVLRPGGIYQSTMLSKRNAQYGVGIEVSPNTFQQPDAEDDKIHPHLYCDAHELLRLHPGMELLSATDREQGTVGTSHWHCLFEVRSR